MKLPHFKKEKVVVIALILIILLGAGLRIKGFYTNKNARSQLLSHVITSEAWTLAKYSKFFHVSDYFYDQINKLSEKDPENYIYRLSEIPTTDAPLINPQIRDEHGAGVILGLIWKITGDANVNWIIILQILLDISAIYFLFLAGRNFFNPTVGLIGALGHARFPAQINAITSLHTYHWTTIISIFILFLSSIIYLKNKEKLPKLAPYLIAIGVLGGASVWFRSSSQVVLISALLLLLFITKNIKQFILRGSIVIVSAIITLTPLLAFHYSETGDLFVSRGIKWHTFLAGLGAIDNPYGLETSDGNIVEKIHERNPEITGYMGDYETRLKPYEKAAKEFYFDIAKENPLVIVKAFFHRFFKIRQFENFNLGGVIQAIFIFYCFGYALIWGVFLTKKKITILNGFLLYALSYYGVISIIYYPDIVYVFPAYPVWYMIAGHSVWTFFKFAPKFYQRLNAKKA